jgi:hypothetical protein
MARNFRVSREVLKQAERLGLGAADAEEIVKDMARRASRITHPQANRRYRNFILFVTPDDVVTMIGAMGEGEASYFGQRTYDERKAGDERKAAEDDGSSGETVAERTRRR